MRKILSSIACMLVACAAPQAASAGYTTRVVATTMLAFAGTTHTQTTHAITVRAIERNEPMPFLRKRPRASPPGATTTRHS